MNEHDMILIIVDLRYTKNVLVSVTLFRDHLKTKQRTKNNSNQIVLRSSWSCGRISFIIPLK